MLKVWIMVGTTVGADTDFRPERTLSPGTFYPQEQLAFLIPGRFYFWNELSRECFITRHILAPGSLAFFIPGTFYPWKNLSPQTHGIFYPWNILSWEHFITGILYPWKNLSQEHFITRIFHP